MMNMATIDAQGRFHMKGNEKTPPAPTNLTAEEMEAFNHCLENNYRLEQEKIQQSYVDSVFKRLRK